MGRSGLEAGCPHPAKTRQSRLGSGWVKSSGRMPLPRCPRAPGGAASSPPPGVGLIPTPVPVLRFFPPSSQRGARTGHAKTPCARIRGRLCD